eukprot:279907-Amphidinium_carterae.1
MIKYCNARSVKMMNCHAITDNQAMLSLAQSLGFEVHETRCIAQDVHDLAVSVERILAVAIHVQFTYLHVCVAVLFIVLNMHLLAQFACELRI